MFFFQACGILCQDHFEFKQYVHCSILYQPYILKSPCLIILDHQVSFKNRYYIVKTPNIFFNKILSFSSGDDVKIFSLKSNSLVLKPPLTFSLLSLVFGSIHHLSFVAPQLFQEARVWGWGGPSWFDQWKGSIKGLAITWHQVANDHCWCPWHAGVAVDQHHTFLRGKKGIRLCSNTHSTILFSMPEQYLTFLNT